MNKETLQEIKSVEEIKAIQIDRLNKLNRLISIGKAREDHTHVTKLKIKECEERLKELKGIK